MMMNAVMLTTAVKGLNNSMRDLGVEVDARNIGDIVVQHAVAGAAAGAAAAVVPGAGALIAVGAAGSSVLAMYVRLAKEMNVKLGNGVLKALASAVVADISATVIGNLGLAAAISFIPGVGSMSAGMLAGISNFGVVYLAAYIFIKTLSSLFASKKDISTMSSADLTKMMKDMAGTINQKEILKEAKQQYKKNGKS